MKDEQRDSFFPFGCGFNGGEREREREGRVVCACKKNESYLTEGVQRVCACARNRKMTWRTNRSYWVLSYCCSILQLGMLREEQREREKEFRCAVAFKNEVCKIWKVPTAAGGQ